MPFLICSLTADLSIRVAMNWLRLQQISVQRCCVLPMIKGKDVENI